MTKNELMTENTILANNYNIVHDALDKMNETIDELHNKIDAQDKIINNQALEIARLKEQINIYENPDDLTLMFMWCDEKAKNKIKKLQQAKDKLQNDYQEARDRIDELISKIDRAIEYIKSINNVEVRRFDYDNFHKYHLISQEELKKKVEEDGTLEGHFVEVNKDKLLEILGDKENE